MDGWGQVDWHYNAPGKPIQSTFIDASMDGCATSSRLATPMLDQRLQIGAAITTVADHTWTWLDDWLLRSDIQPQRDAALRSRNGSAPHPPLPPRTQPTKTA